MCFIWFVKSTLYIDLMKHKTPLFNFNATQAKLFLAPQ